MKIQNIQQNYNQQNKNKYQSVKFKGALDTSLRYLAMNQAVGANLVDITFMVTPRTITEFAKRGPEIGMEALRRESMGTVNDASIGLYGAAAGSVLALALSKQYGLKANNLFTTPATLNILAENKSEQLKNNQTQYDYIKETLKNIKAYNPSSQKSDAEGFVRISDSTIDDVARYFDKSLNAKMDHHTWAKDKTADAKTVILNKITEDTGARADCVLESVDKKIVSKTNLKTLMDDIYMVSDAFNKDTVKKAFQEQIKAGKSIKDNAFVKKLLKFKKTRSAVGFGLAALVGAVVQPLNIYLTKLKTGSDGFVGVEGRSKDKSAGFKAIKVGSSAAFLSMILSSLNISPLKVLKKPSIFMDKMAFAGKLPTLNQLKGVYGITLVSRIFAARDKDELREVLTKDTLGYVSWLVLGDIVNKFVAQGLDKTVMNYKKGAEDKNVFRKTFDAVLKTRDEVLMGTLAKHGISTTKKQNGKTLAKTFKEMVKDLDQLSPAVKKATKKQLRVLNAAQLSGYLFSGLVLGLGIPNLNIYITNLLDKKRKKALEEQQLQQAKKV